MESTSAFKNYVLEATGESVRGIATRLGLDHSALRRQIVGDTRLAVETVTAICRAYDLPIGPAFVQAGILTPEEVAGMNRRTDLSSFTDKELAKEFLRRASRDESVDVPLSEDDDPFLSLPIDQEGADEALRHRHAAKVRRTRVDTSKP